MVSPKSVEYVSPRSGRKHVAHGVSRGLKEVPSPPVPSRAGGGVPEAG